MYCCINFSSKHLQKLAFLLLIIIAVSVSTTGCFLLGRILSPDSISRLDRADLFTVAASSVVPIFPDSEWDEIHIIETDDYGRTLFVYYVSNNNSNGYGKQFWAFVCHKSDDVFAYYYDNCFLKVDDVILTDDQLEALKEINDWNNVIDEDKLSKTRLTDIYARYDNVNDSKIADMFEENESDTEYVYSICKDANGNSLYLYLSGHKNEASFSITDEYIVWLEPDGNMIYNQIDTSKDYLSQIIDFKNKYGWDSNGCQVIFNQR